jgi:F-type H+-transporting ATPase subunit b
VDDARQARVELERLNQESQQILRRAHADAEAILSSTRADAERLREEMSRRRKPMRKTSSATRSGRFNETQRALQQIRHEAVDLSVAIASKLLQRNLTKEDNERLIEEALAQATERKH